MLQTSSEPLAFFIWSMAVGRGGHEFSALMRF